MNIEARKNIIKIGLCIKKGHRAFDGKSRVTCKIYKKRHYVSICSKGSNKGKDGPEPSAPPDLDCGNIASCARGTNGLGSKTADLQTVQAVVNGDKSIRVCVLFGSENTMMGG